MRPRKLRDFSKTISDQAASAVTTGFQTASEKATDSASALGESAGEIARKGADTAVTGIKQVKLATDRAWGATASIADGLVSTPRDILAQALSKDLDSLLLDIAKDGATTTRLKASEYLEASKSIDYGKALEGAVTIAGVIIAVKEGELDEALIEDAFGAVLGLFGNASSIVDLPFADWGKELYEQTAETLQSQFHIPKDWFYNLDVYDNTELLFGAIDVVALVLHWGSEETETFATIAGRLGVWASMSGNPALILVTVVALAKAFHQAHQTGEYVEFVDGHLKGSLGAGATLAAVSVVGIAGGPVGVALLAGMVAGVLAQRASQNVSVIDISKFLTEQTVDLAAGVKALASGQSE